MEECRCFIMGHKDADNSIKDELTAQIERHITEFGVTEFLVGNHGAFDRIAAAALSRVKERYPEIRATLLLAYLPGQGKIELPDGFDESLFPSGLESVPRRFAIPRANQYTVSICRYMIAYAWQPGSNTLKMAETARRKGLEVTYLGQGSYR